MPQTIFNVETGEQVEQEVPQEWLVIPAAAEVLKEALFNIDASVNAQVTQAGIMSPHLFYSLKVADNALAVARWHELGDPAIPVEWMDAWQTYINTGDPAGLPTSPEWVLFCAAVAEAQAYRLTTDPTMTPVKMIQTWEARWMEMRRGFADLAYRRRLQIEQAKTANQEPPPADGGGLGTTP